MHFCPKQKSHRNRRKGQALLEFALVLPILIVLLLGIMEFGWLTRNQLTVANAVREGARAAALGRTTAEITSTIQNDTKTVPGSPNDLIITMKCDDNEASNGYVYDIDLADTTDDDGYAVNDAPSGAMIQVKATIPNKALTGFFPFLNNRMIEVAVVMRRES